MNEYQAKTHVSKLLRILFQNHSLSEGKEIHWGQSAWLDIWHALNLGNIEEAEDDSVEYAGVHFLCDSTLQSEEIRLFRSGKCVKVMVHWQEIE